jgi:UDP-N-acetyl-D-galactosamine dehydrogenase
MGAYVAKKTVQLMLQNEVNIAKSKVLILGFTFKENVKDIRNSKVVDIVEELKSFNVDVDVYDPLASSTETLHEYGFELTTKPKNDYNAVILAVPHSGFLEKKEKFFEKFCKSGIFIDIKGVYRNKINKLNYWSL